MPAGVEANASMDVLLFFVIFGIGAVLFLVFHILALRFHDTHRLLVFIVLMFILAAIATSSLSYFLLADYFSSFASYLVANVAAVFGGFFAAFLYAFLGPATADRSLTAHMLIHLLKKPDCKASKGDLEAEYLPTNFFSKRYAECISAKILVEQEGVVKLTPKGMRIARFYLFQIKFLGLDRRTQHLPSFENKH